MIRYVAYDPFIPSRLSLPIFSILLFLFPSIASFSPSSLLNFPYFLLFRLRFLISPTPFLPASLKADTILIIRKVYIHLFFQDIQNLRPSFFT